jgi:hypothetical protein
MCAREREREGEGGREGERERRNVRKKSRPGDVIRFRLPPHKIKTMCLSLRTLHHESNAH